MKIKRSTVGLVAVVLAILSMSFMAASAATLNSPLRLGSISGTVTDAAGEPLAGIHVNADPVQSVDYDYVSVTTDENGVYTMVVPVGVYRLHFYDGSGIYLETWYGGETWSDAGELPVPGTDVVGIDVVMSKGSTVSGSLAFADGISTGDYTSIELLQSFDDGLNGYWSSIRWTEVYDGLSDWTFTQVPAGTYRVCAYNYGYDVETGVDTSAYQCHGGATVGDAADITIGAEEDVEGLVITFTPPPYSITGSVMDNNGEPVEGINIYAYQTDSMSHGMSPYTTSNADGSYVLPVNNGTYDISFDDYNYQHQGTFVSGIVVDGEDVSGVDVVVEKNYGIVGTLISADGSVPYEANITAYQWVDFSDGNDFGYPVADGEEGYWESMGWGYSMQSNEYVVVGLQPGTYRVCAQTYDDMYNSSGQACHGGGSNPADGADVVAVAGVDTTGVDINLADVEVGTIAGVVTDADGSPLAGIEVSAEFDWNANSEYPMYGGYGHAITAADGSYEISTVPGAYIVRFNDYDGNYISETYDNIEGYEYEEYTSVDVVNGETVIVSAALEASSKLVGNIILDGGGSLAWGSVEVLQLNDEYGWYDSVGWGEIMLDGTYTANGFGAGTYRVCYWFDVESSGNDVYGYGYYSHYECYDGASVPEEATDVVVGSNETVTLDINVTMTIPEVDPDDPNGTVVLPEDSGVITGTVTDASGEPLPNIKVQLYKAYDGYDYGYYDMPPMDMIPPLPIDEDGNVVIPDVPEIVEPEYAFYGAYEVVYTFTDENGQYKIGSLPNGTYHVGFEDVTGAYSSHFYDSRNELHNSTPIMLENSATVANIDGTLAVAGQIGGIIGLGSLENTSEHVQLSLMDMNHYEIAWDSPSADGSYLFGGLPSGEYMLYAYTWDGNYRDEYYDDSQFFEGATPITVVAGEMTTIEFVLDAPAESLITSSNPDMMWVDPWTGEINLFIDPWMDETVLMADSTCADSTTTTAATLVIGWEWDELSNNEFVMTQNEDGSWGATITTDDWLEGNVTINWTCDDEVVTQNVGSSMLYDPSGTIVNKETGNAIEGATVTLYQVPNALPDTADEERNCRSIDTLAGSWSDEPLAAMTDGVVVSVDASRSEPTFSPAVPTQTTAEDGAFGWDVAEGCWYVVASAPGYDSSTSPIVGVPPEVTGLIIELAPTVTVPTAVTLSNVDTTSSTVTVTMMILLVMLAGGVVVVNRKK